MQSIKQLREICQSVHKGDFSAQIVRSVSIYITRILLPTGISGNGVSILNCVAAIAAGAFLWEGATRFMLVGVALFALNTILDGVDGEVARYRKQSSLTGLFADRINTVFVYPCVYYGAGVGLASFWDANWVVHVGAIGGWALVGLRLIKTSIDATLIDAVTLSKARQEESVSGLSASGQYQPMSEYLRGKGKWHMTIVDFFLVRQPGMCVLWVLVAAAEWAVRANLGTEAMVWFSPLVWMLIGYATVGAISICYGIWLVIAKRKVESQFLSVFGPGGRAKL